MQDQTGHVDTAESRRTSRYALVATALFIGQAAWAAVHLGTGGRYQHFVHTSVDIVVDVLLVVVWSLSALATASRWSRAALLPLLGCATSFTHGILMSMSSPFAGVPFLVVGIAVTYAVFRALPAFHRPMRLPPLSANGASQHARTPH